MATKKKSKKSKRSKASYKRAAAKGVKTRKKNAAKAKRKAPKAGRKPTRKAPAKRPATSGGWTKEMWSPANVVRFKSAQLAAIPRLKASLKPKIVYYVYVKFPPNKLSTIPSKYEPFVQKGTGYYAVYGEKAEIVAAVTKAAHAGFVVAKIGELVREYKFRV